ncbi:MAG: GGDEF domain-containing protein [Lachnospiraceae bacterium]|nr:GGDEF domain-containing protein [Lachnospiraceae bacterium]
MDKKKDNKFKMSIYLIIIVLLLALAVAFFEFIKNTSRNRMMDFSEGWTVNFRGVEYQDVDLDKFRFPGGVKRGDLISIKNRLPVNMTNGSAIVFPLQLSTISVDVNGKIVYGYGSRDFADNKMVGSALHIVRLPDDSQGVPVSIVIVPGEDNAFTYLSKMVLDPTSWGFADYLNSNIYPVVVSISLVTAGMIILIISLFLAIKKQDWVRINQTGMLFFTIGCSNIFEIHAIQIFSIDYRWNTFARYFFGILSILPVLRIISSAHLEKRFKDVLVQKTIFYVNEFLIFGAAILGMVNVIHICNTRYFFEVVGVVSMLAVAYIEWKDYSMKELITEARFQEHLICFLFIAIEAVRYISNSIMNFSIQAFQHSFLLYGTVFLVLMMIGSYIYELYESYIKKAEEESLKHIAYTDGLTGLLNRTFCKDRMEDLDRNNKNYYMISFDVDGLKKINDTKGHQAGDKLLTTFADILSQCFSDVGNVIRPGGDEFLVISDDAGKQELISRLGWLDQLEKNAEKALGFPVRASYGLAGREEVLGNTTEEVYYLADQRMYEMKTANGRR